MLANSKVHYQNTEVKSNLDDPVQLMNQKMDQEGYYFFIIFLYFELNYLSHS